jgi:hypothetical protein
VQQSENGGVKSENECNVGWMSKGESVRGAEQRPNGR